MQAYDQHLNMILGDVEEIVTTVEIDDETYEEIVRVCSDFTFKGVFFSRYCLLGSKHRTWVTLVSNIE